LIIYYFSPFLSVFFQIQRTKTAFLRNQNHLTEKIFNFYLHNTQLFTSVYNKFLTNLFGSLNNICIFAYKFIRKTIVFVSKSCAKIQKKINIYGK